MGNRREEESAWLAETIAGDCLLKLCDVGYDNLHVS